MRRRQSSKLIIARKMGNSGTKTHCQTSSGQPSRNPLLTALLDPLLTTPVTRCDDSGALPPPPLPGAPDAKTEPPPPPPPDGKKQDSIAKAAEEASSYTNPGPYETAAMDHKRLVTLDTFDGFRCDINKHVSPYMAVVHSFWLGTSMIPDGRKSTYSFLTQIADEQGLLMARVDPGRGGVDGRIHKALLGGLAMAKLQVGVSADGQSDQVLGELDFGGLSWTGNLKYGSMGGAYMYGCNYFQAITPKLAMGGEGMYLASNGMLLSNYTLKYTMPAKTGDEDSAVALVPPKPLGPLPPGAPPPESGGSSTLSANFNTSQSELVLGYKRVVTPYRVVLGAELICNPLTFESKLLVGAEFKLQRSKINFCVDANSGRIQTLLEAKLGATPGSPSLNFSADVNHLDDDMKFGYGINVDG